MQASTERRAPFSSRIPLDDVLIRLSHHDFEETFEADAVNVGLGGLSMRAAVLPDIGSQLHCEFRSPVGGAAISAACEVVWAEDSGPNVGEFGLRFTDIGADSQDSIRSLMETLDPEEDVLDSEPSRVSIRLEGVHSAIATTLAGRGRDEAVFEQELPFLRLGTGVEEVEGGRRGRLDGVDLRIEDGSPRIILTIRYDAAPEKAQTSSGVIQHLEQTLRVEQVAKQTPVDDDIIDIEEEVSLAGAVDAPVESGDMDTLRDHLPPVAALEVSTVPAAPAAPAEIPEAPRGVTVDRPSDRPSRRAGTARALGSDTLDRARAHDARAALASLVSDLAPRLEKLKLLVLAMWGRVLPWLRTARMKLEDRTKKVRERLVPYGRHVFGRAVRVVLGFAKNLRDRVGPETGRKKAPRRSTSMPPGAMTRRPEGAPRDERPPVNRRRTTLLTIAAFVGVGLGAYALTPSEGSADPEAEEGALAADAEAPTAAETPTSVVVTETTTTLEGAAPAAAPAAPQMPRAMPEPTYQAGPMPAPSYPSLQNGARPPAPRSLPTSSPYAVDVRGGAGAEAAPAADTAPSPAGSTSFGDDAVPNGRSFTLRMSQPIRGIVGSRTEDGFTIRIMDSLSLSRAGPIAARHPFVERSMILNQGSQSELTIRFVDGRNPPFRVEAHGNNLEINIGR